MRCLPAMDDAALAIQIIMVIEVDVDESARVTP